MQPYRHLNFSWFFRASSVLNKNSKMYGPMNALDVDNSTTCWSSSGSPSGKQRSHYILDFGRPVLPMEIRLQCQAGFIGEKMLVFWQDMDSWSILADKEVDDDHDLQTFSLVGIHQYVRTNALKLVFDECTDFYGRVTLYQLQVWGFEVDDAH